MKKILIIGSEGYIASQIYSDLINYGYECTGIDLGLFRKNIFYSPPDIPMIDKEARDISIKDIQGFDIVLQLAGISNDPIGSIDPKVMYDPTRQYSLEIAKLCKKSGVRFIFPSSCSVYGVSDSESSEISPPDPQTPYSLNKVQVEEDLSSIADKDFSPIALRLATVYGISPRMRFDLVINMFCGMALTQKKIILNSNGLAWRPNIHIYDVCQAFRKCIEWNYSKDELMILNVGRNDGNAQIIDLANKVAGEVDGCKIRFANDSDEEIVKSRNINDGVDKRNYKVNFDKIHKTLPDFQPEFNLDDGIKNLLSELTKEKLTLDKFKKRDFYRLQSIEYLYQTKQIDKNLHWVN